MANEISVSVSLTAAKGNAKVAQNASLKADWNTARRTSGTQSIGTAYEQIVLGADVATAGIAFFRNLDSVNYVEIGVVVSSTFYPLLKLKPGESQLVRLATTTIYARANTAAVDLDFEILAD